MMMIQMAETWVPFIFPKFQNVSLRKKMIETQWKQDSLGWIYT